MKYILKNIKTEQFIQERFGDKTTDNRVDGLTGFFTDEVRLSHHVAYGSRTTRFAEHNATALYTNCIFVLL